MTIVSESELPINENWLNFGGLVAEVLQYGFNDGPQVNRKRIEAWINDGQFQIAREVEAPEFQETVTYQLEPAVHKYPLPADFLRMQDVYYPEAQGRLRPVDIQSFDLTTPIVEAPPEMYTFYASEIWFFPTPNNEDTLEARYIKRPPWLINETDIPILNPNYWWLLIEWALIKAFAAEDDPEASQAHKGEYKEGLDAYASDVQSRLVDRPKQVDGTWAGTYSNRGVW